MTIIIILTNIIIIIIIIVIITIIIIISIIIITIWGHPQRPEISGHEAASGSCPASAFLADSGAPGASSCQGRRS